MDEVIPSIFITFNAFAFTAALAAACDARVIALDEIKEDDLELFLALSLLLLPLEEELDPDFDDDLSDPLEFDSELEEFDF